MIDGTNALRVGDSDIKEPPKATLSQRAQSYTDFHHAARAAILSGSLSHRLDKHKHDEDIKNDIDFSEWYQDLEQDLLEASQDHAQYAMRCHMVKILLP